MISNSDIDRLGTAIVDLELILKRLGMTAAIRVHVRQEDEAALAQVNSRWVTRASKETSIRVAGAMFSVGG